MASHNDSSKDSSTKKVLDYYEKYSQNSNLSKYFSGSSVQYLPVIDIPLERNYQNTIKLTAPEPLITSFSFDELSSGCKNKNIFASKQLYEEAKADKNILNGFHNSPLVSPSDNKKLEWDSGADIGYHISQNNAVKKSLRKCVSLPVLYNSKHTKFMLNAPDLSTTLRSDNVKVFIFSSSPDSTSLNQEVTEDSKSESDVSADNDIEKVANLDVPSSSNSSMNQTKSSRESSSNSESEKSKLLDFKMTLSYLKGKIGSPGAHSTPNIPDINNIDSKKSAESFTNKNLNKKKDNIFYKELKSVGDTHMENFSFVSQVMKKDVKMQIKDQSSFPKHDLEKGSISFKNIENENCPQNAIKGPNKKVIELTLSKPISLDWACSEIMSKEKLVERCEVGPKLEPKAVQTEGIFEFNLKSSKKPPITANKYQPTFLPENETANKPYSDCSSNCDSFEYISSAADIRSLKEKKVLQPLRNKNDLPIIGNPKLLNVVGALFKHNFLHKNVSCSSSASKSVSEDIEKHVELLQRLLRSKTIHSNKKKYYIKKLLQDISDFECLDSEASSGQFFTKNNKQQKDCDAPNKESTSSGHSTGGKETISSSEGNPTFLKEDKKQSECFSENRSDTDYLLKFAENERAYQIHWIDNEITHLTKLKTILEFNDCRTSNKRKTNQTSFQKQPLKTSVYKIQQKDGVSKNSDREYVIETKFDIPTDKRISYCLQGKKYLVTDCKTSKTSTNSNENFIENYVTADVKVQAEEKQTSIKISTSCYICKQEPCICDPDMSGIDRSATNKQCDVSTKHTCKSVSKMCPSFHGLKCVCQERESIRPTFDVEDCNNSNSSVNPTKEFEEKLANPQDFLETKKENILSSQSSDVPGYNLPEDFNSLQKIFQNCCCTIENKECTCLFVKKLFNRLMPNDNIHFSKHASSSPGEIKSAVVYKDNEGQTNTLTRSNKEQFFKNGFQINGIQANPSNTRNLQSPSDHLLLVMSKTTQTTEILKNTSLEQCATKSECNNAQEKNSQIINGEKHLIKGKNEFTKKNIVENVVHNYIDKIQNPNVVSVESVLPEADVSSQKATMNGKTVLIKYPNKQQKSISKIERGTTTEDSSLTIASNINTKYKDIAIQVSVDLLTKIKHGNKQNEITKNGGIKRIDDSNLNEASKSNTNYKDIGVQASVGEKRHPIKKQNEVTTLVGVTRTYSDRNSASTINTKYKNVNGEDNVDLLTKRKHSNKRQNDIFNSKGVTNTEDNRPNSSSEINTKYNDIGVQTSVGLKTYSLQTSDQDLDKKIYRGHKKASFEGKFNNLQKKNDIENDDFSKNKLLPQKELDTDNIKSDKSIDIKTTTNVPNNKSEILGSKYFKEMDAHPRTQLTSVSKEEVISDGTFANYSQTGSTSANISTSVFDSRSIPSSRLTCICCRKKAFVAEVSYIQNENASYAMCSRCYYNKAFYNVSNCQHQNRCLKRESEQTSNCYQCCNCKHKLVKSSIVPKGVVYNLIIQEPIANKDKKQFTKVDLEDFNRNKAIDGKSDDNGYKKKNPSNASISDEPKKKNNKGHDMSQQEPFKENKMQYTLTDYLIMNRPEFIYSAENRRQSVLNSRILREHQKDILKLHFLENNLNRIANKGPYKLFTEREMKDITKRNYQKLPETQKKLINLQEKRLRYADKLICDIFAKKVQRSALKGKWNFPIDKTLTNL